MICSLPCRLNPDDGWGQRMLPWHMFIWPDCQNTRVQLYSFGSPSPLLLLWASASPPGPKRGWVRHSMRMLPKPRFWNYLPSRGSRPCKRSNFQPHPHPLILPLGARGPSRNTAILQHCSEAETWWTGKNPVITEQESTQSIKTF